MSSGHSDDEVVVDAGPLIALARLGALELPARVFVRSVVTRTVAKECLADPAYAEFKRIQAAITTGFLEVVDDLQKQPIGLWNLDSGEASVIALAQARGAGVLLDDRVARRAAKEIGMPVIGTCGLLLMAKRRKLIPAVSPLLHQLIESGYYLDRPLIDRVCKLAGEV